MIKLPEVYGFLELFSGIDLGLIYGIDSRLLVLNLNQVLDLDFLDLNLLD